MATDAERVQLLGVDDASLAIGDVAGGQARVTAASV
jgi:hypothetical protein